MWGYTLMVYSRSSLLILTQKKVQTVEFFTISTQYKKAKFANILVVPLKI